MLKDIWIIGALLYAGLSFRYTGSGRPMGTAICSLIWPVCLLTLGLFWVYRKLTKKGFEKDPSEVEMTLCLMVSLLVFLVPIAIFRIF